MARKTSFRRSLVAALLAFTALLVVAVSSGKAWSQGTTVTDTAGGRGGGPFRLTCPSGMAMTGITGRYGAWVDAVAPICSIWVRNNRTLGEIAEQPGTGGGGGGPGWIRCQGPRGAVHALWVWPIREGTGIVGRIYLDCGDYEQPSRFANKLPGGADGLGNGVERDRRELSCGPNEVAVGLYGRSGAFIDQIGLLCQRSRGLPR